jgi:hypothetical protein
MRGIEDHLAVGESGGTPANRDADADPASHRAAEPAGQAGGLRHAVIAATPASQHSAERFFGRGRTGRPSL